MFDRLSPRGCALLAAAAILIPVVAAWLWLAGSVVVIDDTGEVTSAVVTNNGGIEQRLYRLWTGHFYAIPSVEGVIEVRCRNGARTQWGYVTQHMSTKVRVVGHKPCQQVVDA